MSERELRVELSLVNIEISDAIRKRDSLLCQLDKLEREKRAKRFAPNATIEKNIPNRFSTSAIIEFHLMRGERVQAVRGDPEFMDVEVITSNGETFKLAHEDVCFDT